MLDFSEENVAQSPLATEWELNPFEIDLKLAYSEGRIDTETPGTTLSLTEAGLTIECQEATGQVHIRLEPNADAAQFDILDMVIVGEVPTLNGDVGWLYGSKKEPAFIDFGRAKDLSRRRPNPLLLSPV